MGKRAEMAAGEGHNSAGDEQNKRVLFFIGRSNYLKTLKAKKEADAAFKNACKVIKADLGEYGVTQIKDYEKAQTPEGQAELKAKQEAQLQAMRFAGMPINTQLDLCTDRTPTDDRAYQRGEEAGLRGDTLANPYNEASAEGQEFARGWHDGQGALFAGIKKKEAEASTDERIAGHDSDEEGDGETPNDPFGDPDQQGGE